MNEFLDRLSELMGHSELNRLDLAKALNISSTTVNGYFNKGYYPHANIAIDIALYFNCSLDYLFGLSNVVNTTIKLSKESFMKILMVNLETLRNETNISIAKLMRELNMTEDNYYRWRRGMIPKMNSLILLARYFKVGLDELLGKRI